MTTKSIRAMSKDAQKTAIFGAFLIGWEKEPNGNKKRGALDAWENSMSKRLIDIRIARECAPDYTSDELDGILVEATKEGVEACRQNGH